MDTTIHNFLLTLLISMVPVVELRGGIPFGMALGLSHQQALIASLIGNMIPAPFIIVYIRQIFAWIRVRSDRWNAVVNKLEEKAREKGNTVQKYRAIGLFILVAIPLPGTGVWTGSLVAGFLDIRLRRAVPLIFLGVCAAAAITSCITLGFAYLL